MTRWQHGATLFDGSPTARFVILRLPEPRSERSERDAAEDAEGSPGALLGAGAKPRFL
jgi:hypothetical protein